MEKQVIVLLTEWNYDGEGGKNAEVFADMDSARKSMVRDFEQVKKDWFYDEDGRINVANSGPTSASIGCDEDWMWYHCTWEIYPTIVRGGEQ